MERRSLTTLTVLVAVLLSGLGNVLAASLCPRMDSDHSCCARRMKHETDTHDLVSCDTMLEHKTASHEVSDAASELTHETSPVRITSTPALFEPLPEENVARALGDLAKSCSHCAGHSGPPESTLAIRGAESPKRYEALAAIQIFQEILSAFVKDSIFAPREHAPPGEASPRHLLLNVFRI